MSWFYRQVIRPGLFAWDSETIHDRTLAALARVAREETWCDALAEWHAAPPLPVELFGLRFPNPVGLAAGMDKHAAAVPVWAALGFGFCELGGVTWHAQPGNPAPRMFRVVADQALINRMGFNNGGAEAMAETLAEWRRLRRWPAHPVGINLGKSKITPLDQAARDYASSFRVLRAHADFFVVNVSSPNTPNLRQLQDKAALDEILAALQEINGDALAAGAGAGAGAAGVATRSGAGSSPAAPSTASGGKPILVKVAPDLAFEAIDEILELIGPRRVAGVVATNTTIRRPAVASADPALARVYAETGGLSGRPLRSRSTEVIRHIHCQTRGAVPIIGVGGIFNAADAWEKVVAGASLVQVYTGLVYEGPTLARSIVRGLTDRLAQAGLRRLRDAVGQGTRLGGQEGMDAGMTSAGVER